MLKNFNGEKFQSGRWTFSTGVLKNPLGVFKRVNEGIEKIRWGFCVGSMGALVRVNGGMEKGTMVSLVRVNGAIEKGQVRQGLGCGSDRGVAARQTGGCLTRL